AGGRELYRVARQLINGAHIMKHGSALFAALATVGLGLLAPATAQAQIFKTFVASPRSNADYCSPTPLPCRTFQPAHDQTFATGQIACVDSVDDDLGPVTINKSITIDCAGTSATVFNFVINTAGIVVVIRNLGIFGTPAETGINFTNGATLIVE